MGNQITNICNKMFSLFKKEQLNKKELWERLFPNKPYVENYDSDLITSMEEKDKSYNSTVLKSMKSLEKNFELNHIKDLDKVTLDDFINLKLLGKGSFGKVLLVKNNKDNNFYAMKILNKSNLIRITQIEHAKTEREILEKINHPFIVSLQFAFQTEDKLYLITDFMQGGELFFHLKKEKKFSLKRARLYICEILLGLEHLHKNNIIYRDLKPENILMDKDGHIKLADFGLSKHLKNNSEHNNKQQHDTNNCNSCQAYTVCGTPDYLAPEILMGTGYDKTVDYWSFGVLIYEMLTGVYPFKSHIPDLKDIKDDKVDINFNQKSLCVKSKDLINRLLTVQPSKRIGYGQSNADEIKNHAFFEGIEWDKVYNKQYELEFVPMFKDIEDLHCFDKKYTGLDINEIMTKKKKFLITTKKSNVVNIKNNNIDNNLINDNSNKIFQKFTFIKN
jgi:serine/threonine protein kinase